MPSTRTGRSSVVRGGAGTRTPPRRIPGADGEPAKRKARTTHVYDTDRTAGRGTSHTRQQGGAGGGGERRAKPNTEAIRLSRELRFKFALLGGGQWRRTTARVERSLGRVQKQTLGIFACPCGNAWSSAYAFVETFGQECIHCKGEAAVRPCYLWQNLDSGRDRPHGRADSKPHPKGLCEGCKAGVCKQARA